MRKTKTALCLAALPLAFLACDSGGGPGGNDRQYRPPSVFFAAEDSLVLIRMIGSREGDESSYWVYRNDSLLDIPHYAPGAEGAAHAYILIDSLAAAGKYRYFVRYGTDAGTLSEKSKEFSYEYAGPSPSGRLQAYPGNETGSPPALLVFARKGSHAGGVKIERKINALGKAVTLDSVMGPPDADAVYQFIDTAYVADNALLHYRASVWDALEEEWLEPTAWDTLRVENRFWDYLPALQISTSGTEVSATLLSLPAYPAKAKFYLCRNDGPSRSGRDVVDSLFSYAGFASGHALTDIPDGPGTYWYWVEGVDQYGRESLRSAPKAVEFTGRPMGPSIAFLSVSTFGIQVRFDAGGDFPYAYVLQRAQDTGKAAVDVDTLAGGAPEYALTDRPPSNGIWFYRVVGMDEDGKRGDPGRWMESAPYEYVPIYSSFSALIQNKGDRVEAQASPVFWGTLFYQILYRSKYSSGKDSVAVDTVSVNSTTARLEDRPPQGTWYYHVQQIPFDPSTSATLYRSPLTRIDFTGKRVGPGIQSVQVYSAYIGVNLVQDADLAAVILERSLDGSGTWTAVDTLPYGISTRNDRPPTAGTWSYRARGILHDLAVTDPGSPMRASGPWTLADTWSYAFTATLSNMGQSVEATGYAPVSYSGTVRLMRGPGMDYKGGVAVDSLKNAYFFTLRDTPPAETWYYWVEQTPADPYGNMGYRSAITKIDFTGAPEILSLAKTGSGIQVNFPRVPAGDTVEVWRASEMPDDPDSYSKISSVPMFGSNSYTVDMTVDLAKRAFYHYRLVLVHGGTRSEPGSYKTIFYEP